MIFSLSIIQLVSIYSLNHHTPLLIVQVISCLINSKAGKSSMPPARQVNKSTERRTYELGWCFFFNFSQLSVPGKVDRPAPWAKMD